MKKKINRIYVLLFIYKKPLVLVQVVKPDSICVSRSKSIHYLLLNLIFKVVISDLIEISFITTYKASKPKPDPYVYN